MIVRRLVFVADFFGYVQGILPKDVPEASAQMKIYVDDRALLKARAQGAHTVPFNMPAAVRAAIAPPAMALSNPLPDK